MSKSYVKTATHEAKKGEFDICLLLYSGGLDTSVMLKWIQEKYDCEVVTLTLDIGQRSDNLQEIKQKALKLGAKEAIVYDATHEFASKVLTKAIKANADYQGGYALSTPLGRVVISEIAVKVAQEYSINVIAHGATGKGNDQVRFETYIPVLDSKIKIIAPVREWSMGRNEELEYAELHGIPVKQTVVSPYSYDENLWGNTAEGGAIENPAEVPALKDILQWCNTIESSPEDSEKVTISFEKGIPIKLDGEKLDTVDIIKKLNKVGAKHGVGVIQLIEDRLIGMKVRGVYENPAAAILIAAHKKLEMLVSTKEENYMKTIIDQKWSELVYGAQWYEPLMQNLNAYIDAQSNKVSGDVTVRLHKGNVDVVSLKSENSLLDIRQASFNKDITFNQNAAPGYIEFYSLAQRTAYAKKNGV